MRSRSTSKKNIYMCKPSTGFIDEIILFNIHCHIGGFWSIYLFLFSFMKEERDLPSGIFLPNSCNSQDWPITHIGAWNSVLVSYTGGRLSLLPHHLLPPRVRVSRKLESMVSRGRILNSNSGTQIMDASIPRCVFSCCASCQSQLIWWMTIKKYLVHSPRDQGS